MSKSYQCKITADIPVRVECGGCRDTLTVFIDIEYVYHPSNGKYGTLGEFPELELLSATLIDSDGLGPTDRQVKEWAADWLDDKGYDIACEHAEKCIADLCGNYD